MHKLVDAKTGLSVSLPAVRHTADGREVKVLSFREPTGEGEHKDGHVMVSSSSFVGSLTPAEVGLKLVDLALHHITEGMIVRSYDLLRGRDAFVVGQVKKIAPLEELQDTVPRYHIRVIMHVDDEGVEMDEVVPYVYPPVNGARLTTGEIINCTEPNWLEWD